MATTMLETDGAVDYERTVLGCLLVDHVCAKSIMETVTEHDFSDPKNKAVFRAMVKVYAHRRTCDVISVSCEMPPEDRDMEYLCDLLDALVIDANGLFYARRLAGIYNMRVRYSHEDRGFIATSDKYGATAFGASLYEAIDELHAVIDLVLDGKL